MSYTLFLKKDKILYEILIYYVKVNMKKKRFKLDFYLFFTMKKNLLY